MFSRALDPGHVSMEPEDEISSSCLLDAHYRDVREKITPNPVHISSANAWDNLRFVGFIFQTFIIAISVRISGENRPRACAHIHISFSTF